MSLNTQSSGKLSYHDYLGFPSDGQRHEIIDGVHVVNPAPDTYHQTLSRRIQFQLYAQIELKKHGEVFNSPTDLQLSDTDIVQPDLIVVLQDKRSIITPRKMQGVPNLVVEILSPSSVNTDRVLKKELYRRAGVPEYWIVDPIQKFVEQYVLRDNAYQLVNRHSNEVVPQIIEGVRVNLDEVW